MLSDEFSRDAAQCFFDLQGFGEAMKLNGKSVLVVADAEKLQQRKKDLRRVGYGGPFIIYQRAGA